MSGYSFAITCPECGGPVAHRDCSGDPEHQQAEVWCPACLAVYAVDVRLTLVRAEAMHFHESDRARRERAGWSLGDERIRPTATDGD